MIYFKSNNRKQQLDRYENIVRENGWLPKGAQFERADRFMYVIMDGSHLVGYYTLQHHESKQVEIKWVYIFPEYQNKGYGTQLIHRCVKTLYNLNKNTVYCQVERDNDLAHALCSRWCYIMGVDERLYDPNQTRMVKAMEIDGELVYVFYQKSWGETKAIMRKELEDVVNSL